MINDDLEADISEEAQFPAKISFLKNVK